MNSTANKRFQHYYVCWFEIAGSTSFIIIVGSPEWDLYKKKTKHRTWPALVSDQSLGAQSRDAEQKVFAFVWIEPNSTPNVISTNPKLLQNLIMNYRKHNNTLILILKFTKLYIEPSANVVSSHDLFMSMSFRSMSLGPLQLVYMNTSQSNIYYSHASAQRNLDILICPLYR